MKELFKQFDANGYSVWRLDYIKAEGECEVMYQTSNLLVGFIQRFPDPFRKYALGVHGIFGEEPALAIRGLWILRGQKFPRVWVEHPTTEYYKTEQLDMTKAEHQAIVEDYLCGKEGSNIDGMKAQKLIHFK